MSDQLVFVLPSERSHSGTASAFLRRGVHSILVFARMGSDGETLQEERITGRFKAAGWESFHPLSFPSSLRGKENALTR